ncbi:MAG: hypothetical protein Q4P22_06605 [Eubacteriales bacterium]|nr:hypothetical protein [Eubacteriales bacterium]
MKHKCRSYRRMQREKHIERKKRILRDNVYCTMPKIIDDKDVITCDEQIEEMGIIGVRYYPFFNVKAEGCLSKGKIHCSCPLCSFHGTTMQDRRNIDRMNDEILEYRDGDFCDSDIPISEVKQLSNKLKKISNGNGAKSGFTYDTPMYFNGDRVGRKTKNVVEGYEEFKLELSRTGWMDEEMYVNKELNKLEKIYKESADSLEDPEHRKTVKKIIKNIYDNIQ